jgi:hypothetical protein
MMKKTFTLICLLLACAYCFAQDRNNEDEVVKIDWYNQHATKEGELIVKFADHTPLRLQNDARGILQATGIDKVDALLQRYPVAMAERLCLNDNPNRELKTSNKQGNLPKEVWEMFVERMRLTVKQDPSFSTIWKSYAQAFNQYFAAFFDNEIFRKTGLL